MNGHYANLFLQPFCRTPLPRAGTPDGEKTWSWMGERVDWKELRGNERGTRLEEATHGLQGQQQGNLGEQVLAQGQAKKQVGLILLTYTWVATDKTTTLGPESCSEVPAISGC